MSLQSSDHMPQQLCSSKRLTKLCFKSGKGGEGGKREERVEEVVCGNVSLNQDLENRMCIDSEQVGGKEGIWHKELLFEYPMWATIFKAKMGVSLS